LGLRAPSAAIPEEAVKLPPEHPAAEVYGARVVSLPKKAALYTMKLPAEQRLMTLPSTP
jgi:hypothetical protein